MTDMTLSESEQRAILESPPGIMLLMSWYVIQQAVAEANNLDCTAIRARYEELKAHGRALIEEDGADRFKEEVLRAFGFPIPSSVPASAAAEPR